jgi:hypothetical protein
MKKRIQRKYILAGGIAVAIIVLLFGILDQTGYVFSGPYLVKGGSLIVAQAQPNSDVFIDNRRAGKTNANGGGSFDGIKSGTRNVIVAHPDFWPWILDFESAPGQTTTLQPLQVRRDPVESSIVRTDAVLKDQADAAFVQYREPTRIQPLSRNGVRVWIEGTTIVTQTGEVLVELFSSKDPIRTIFWYGERSDAVVVASRDTVFALDIRTSRVQNFFPIYQGVAPEAVADPERVDTIFIKDNNEYLSVDI